MVHALVIVSGTGLEGESLSSFPFLSVSEVPQLKRILINAERAGVTDFTLICDENDKLSLLKLINDKRIKSRIDLVTEKEKFVREIDESVVIQSNLLAHSTTVKRFLESSGSLSVDVLSDDRKNYYGLLKVRKADVKKIANGRDLKSWVEKKNENRS